LGLGIPPSIPAWGSMVSAGRNYLLTAWWVSTFPGLAILLLVMAINLFGEGLRDILDPRLKIE
jgi:peptide/nickel transport system permease protein